MTLPAAAPPAWLRPVRGQRLLGATGPDSHYPHKSAHQDRSWEHLNIELEALEDIDCHAVSALPG